MHKYNVESPFTNISNGHLHRIGFSRICFSVLHFSKSLSLRSLLCHTHTHFTRILDVWNFRLILCYNGHIIKCVNWKTLKYWTVNGNVCIHWHMKLINLHCFIVRRECNHLMVANQSECHGHSWHSNEWSGFRFACSTYFRPYSTYAENERYPNGLFHHILCISLFLLHLNQYYCLESRLTIHKFQDKKKIKSILWAAIYFPREFHGDLNIVCP